MYTFVVIDQCYRTIESYRKCRTVYVLIRSIYELNHRPNSLMKILFNFCDVFVSVTLTILTAMQFLSPVLKLLRTNQEAYRSTVTEIVAETIKHHSKIKRNHMCERFRSYENEERIR